MKQWYYADENEDRKGPVDEVTIKEMLEYGAINQDTYVLNESMWKWKKVKDSSLGPNGDKSNWSLEEKSASLSKTVLVLGLVGIFIPLLIPVEIGFAVAALIKIKKGKAAGLSFVLAGLLCVVLGISIQVIIHYAIP